MRNLTEQEFEQKYYEYKKMLYNIAYSYVHNQMDADDVIQDVFIKYLKSSEKFQTVENEKYWLIRVTINTCKSYLKQTRFKYIELNEDIVNKTCAVKLEEEQKYFLIITSLPHKYQEVIILYYYEDLKINEISTILKISVSAVKKRLERARNMIKNKEKEYV